VRVAVREDEALLPWLREIQARQVEMRRFEYSPLVQIQGWSEVPRGQPLFESILVFENYPADASLPGRASSVGIREVQILERTNYALTASVVPGAELRLRIISDARLFGAVTIGRMLGHWRILLEGIAAGPGRHLADLPLLTGAEREQLLRQWNETEVAPAPHPGGAPAALPDLDRLTDEELDTWINLLQEPTGGTCRESGPGSDLQALS
jgi:non-ribosomal peptide synthetase component F